MSFNWVHKPTMVCASLLLAGCTPATVPQRPPLDDAIAHVQLADPLAAVGEATLGIPLSPAKLHGSARCPFDARAGRFECAAFTAGTLTYTRSYQLLGETGHPLSDWDESVASIRLITDVAGSVSTARGTFEVRGRDDATLGDLRALRQTLRGVGTLTWSDGQSAWSSRRTAELLVLSRSRMPGTFPAGSIELRVAQSAPAQERSANLTFDGSPIVSMLLSFDGKANVVCKFDLQSPDAPTDCD